MRANPPTTSPLDDLSDEQMLRQLRYALANGWSVSIEHSDDPHPRNAYWEMWGEPMSDFHDASTVMGEVKACRVAHAQRYVRVVAIDGSRGRERVRIAFLAHRPPIEPSFELLRERCEGRRVRYTVRALRPAAVGSP